MNLLKNNEVAFFTYGRVEEEMKYIDEEFVIGINKCICESQGVQSVIINRNNLLSALSVQQWYDDDCERACALLRSISIGHLFKDGNKRTAAIRNKHKRIRCR